MTLPLRGLRSGGSVASVKQWVVSNEMLAIRIFPRSSGGFLQSRAQWPILPHLAHLDLDIRWDFVHFLGGAVRRLPPRGGGFLAPPTLWPAFAAGLGLFGRWKPRPNVFL